MIDKLLIMLDNEKMYIVLKKVFVNGCISLLYLLFVGNSSAQNQVPPPVEDVFHTVDNTLDSMKIVRMARPVPGKSRKGG